MTPHISEFVSSLLFGYVAVQLTILIHELAHYLTAKFYKISIAEFSLGIGPGITLFRFRETVFRLRLLPIGGYVLPLDFDEHDDPIKVITALEPDSQSTRRALLMNQQGWVESHSIWEQRIFILAGVIANFGATVLLLLTIITWLDSWMPDRQEVQMIKGVAAGSPAEAAGLKAGQIIVCVNGLPLPNHAELQWNLDFQAGKIALLVSDRDSHATKTLVLQRDDFRLSAGVETEVLQRSRMNSCKLLALSKHAFTESSNWTQQSWLTRNMTGPLGLLYQFGSPSEKGWIEYGYTLAILNIAISLFNLCFPLAQLDGPRLLLTFLHTTKRHHSSDPNREPVVCTRSGFHFSGLIPMYGLADTKGQIHPISLYSLLSAFAIGALLLVSIASDIVLVLALL